MMNKNDKSFPTFAVAAKKKLNFSNVPSELKLFINCFSTKSSLPDAHSFALFSPFHRFVKDVNCDSFSRNQSRVVVVDGIRFLAISLRSFREKIISSIKKISSSEFASREESFPLSRAAQTLCCR